MSNRAAKVQDAAKLREELAQAPGLAEEEANRKRAELQSYFIQQELALDRRAGFKTDALERRLENYYGPSRAQYEARAAELDAALEADGLKKTLRDMMGLSARDQQERTNIQRSLEDGMMREDEARAALARQLRAEKEVFNAEREQRTASYEERVLSEQDAQLQSVRDKGHTPSTYGNYPPANANQRPLEKSWERAATPEQDNIKEAPAPAELQQQQDQQRALAEQLRNEMNMAAAEPERGLDRSN